MDCHSVDTDFVCDADKNESVFVGKDSYSDDTDFVSISPKKKRCSPRLKTKDLSAPRQSRTLPKHIHVPNPAPATCGKKRKQPESIQKVQIVGYRCAPHRVPPIMKSLSPLQKSYINKIGFQSLLSMAECELPKGLTIWLIKNVDCDKGTLEIGGKSIPIKHLTKKLLGVPCGNMQVPAPMDVDSALKVRFSNGGRGKPVNVAIPEMISETDEETFCKYFMLVMFCLYLAPNTSHYINRSLLSTVSDIKNIKEMNWCDFISDYLLQGIRDYKASQSSNVQVRGCVHILDLIYVDFVYAPSILTPRGIPRLEHITTAHLKSLSSFDVKSSTRNHTDTQFGRLKVRNLSETLYALNGDEKHGVVGDTYKETSISKENLSKPYQNDVHSDGDAETGKTGDETDAMAKLIDKFNMKLQSRRSQLVKDAIQYFESRIASSDAEIIAEFRDEIRNKFGAPAQDEDADKVNEDDHVHVDEDDHVPAKANEEDSIPAKDIEEDMAPNIQCNNLPDEVVQIGVVAAQEATGIDAQSRYEDAAKVIDEDNVHVVGDDQLPAKANEEDLAPAKFIDEYHGFAKANEDDHAQGGAAEIDEFHLVAREPSTTLVSPTETELQAEMDRLQRNELTPTPSTIQLPTPIEIGDSEGTPRPEDAQNIHPLLEPIPGGERFPDPGSVPVATKQRSKRYKKTTDKVEALGQLVKNKSFVKPTVAQTFKEHVMCGVTEKPEKTKVIIGGAHVTAKEFSNALCPRKGEVCNNFMWLCCKALMLDWDSKKKIIVDPIATAQLMISYLQSDEAKIAAGFSKVPIEELERIFIPILLDQHWSLIFVDLLNETVEIYDTMKNPKQRQQFYHALWYNVGINLQQVLSRLRGHPIGVYDIFNVQHPKIPLQSTIHDCGFCVLRMLECHNGRSLIGYNTANVEDYKKELAYRLIYHRFNDLNPNRISN